LLITLLEGMYLLVGLTIRVTLPLVSGGLPHPLFYDYSLSVNKNLPRDKTKADVGLVVYAIPRVAPFYFRLVRIRRNGLASGRRL
jgi:hypothetical protein